MFIKGYNVESCVKGDLSRMDEDLFGLIADNEIYSIESIIDDILEIQSRCESNVQKKRHIGTIDFSLFCTTESDTVIVVQIYYSPVPVEIKYHWSTPLPLSYREGEQFDLNWKYSNV